MYTSQKPSQAKRLEFRTTRDGVMPSSIGLLTQLTIDPAMKAALTHAGAKLVVELDAGGTRVLLADGRTNQLIGGPEDLQKLGSIRTFVNRERKDATAVEAAKETTQLAFLSEKLVKETKPEFEMNPVDSAYGAALRPMQSALEQIAENEKRLSENTSQVDRETYEPEYRRFFTGMGRAYTDVISLLTEGKSIKGSLNEKLFDEGIPEWIHTRFASKSFTLGRTDELRKLIFPTDPSKGLALSFKEWRSEGFLKKQGPLLANCHLASEIISDDDLLRAITGIAADVPLDSEENPASAKLQKARLVVMPLAQNADRIIETGSKTRTGFKFPNPSMDTIVGSITSLSTALLRVYSANLQSVDIVGDYYATIAPGAVRREDVTPTNNFYVQWGKAANRSAVWIEAIQGGPRNFTLRQKVFRWIRTEMRLSEAGQAGKALAEALHLEKSGNVPDKGHVNGRISPSTVSGVLTAPDSARAESEMRKQNLARAILRDLTDTEIPFWQEFSRRVFPSKDGKKRQPVGLALTPLSFEGKQLVHRVKQVSPYVAGRMQSWLRSFSDERLQLAAIKVTNAEFDDIFTTAVDADDDDSQSNVDWAETEA